VELKVLQLKILFEVGIIKSMEKSGLHFMLYFNRISQFVAAIEIFVLISSHPLEINVYIFLKHTLLGNFV